MDEMLPLARLGGRHTIRRSRIWVPVIITLMGQESCQKVLIQHFFGEVRHENSTLCQAEND